MKYLFLMFLSTSALANSIATFQGKLISITEKDIAIQTEDKTVYFIKKSALDESDKKQVTQVGKQVALFLPLEAVDTIKRPKK